MTLFLNVVTIYLEATSFVTKNCNGGKNNDLQREDLAICHYKVLLASNKTTFILVTKMVTIFQKKKKIFDIPIAFH